MQPYDPALFANLNVFHLAKKALSEELPNVRSLGDVICIHGLENSVGVNLLHRHFDISDEERLTRIVAESGREAIVRPIAAGAPNSVPYLWLYADGRHGAGFYPLEFVQCDDEELLSELKRDVTTLEQSTDFLGEFASVLTTLGMSNTFGLASLKPREQFALEHGYTLLEKTDHDNRVLTLDVVLESETSKYESTQTLWIFNFPDIEEWMQILDHNTSTFGENDDCTGRTS